MGSWRDDPGVAALAPVVAARRTALPEAKTLIADFAARTAEADRPARLSTLFAGIFSLIERERGAIITGVSRYAHKQAALAERIEGMRVELAGLKAAEQKDFDRIEELEDTIVWDERIFEDRAQSLTYVCESPVILEKRAFALARAVMAHLP